MTFSIVGFDPEEKEWGVAVQSKFFGVGAVVPFAKAGVGAVATQSYANTAYGPQAIALMAEGRPAAEVMEKITKNDPDKEMRQVGMVDANGCPATFTGAYCFEWAGGITGKHFAAQGNILAGENTVKAMADTFVSVPGSLGERLLAALAAGQEAGGDKRGQQSAALLVVKENGGYAGYNDRYIDLRVDDHPEPIKELFRLHTLHRLYFASSRPERIAVIEGEVKKDLIAGLLRQGYIKAENPSGAELFDALTAYLHTENFEEKEQERGKIDLDVLDFLLNPKSAG